MKLIKTTLCASAALAAIALVFAAAPAAADQCILDDLIVDGSECVGIDCVCNMNFGFDTIVLQENNLRIFFNDTSSSASFPTANWRIVANDSSNGGAEYLAFEDSDNGNFPFRVFHDGGANALVVKGKRVGINTASPVVELHVVDGDTPTLRLEQNGSSGFTPQTYDVAANETNFFVRDVTMGSKLPFRLRPGAPTSSIDVAASGNVGIGTTSPSAPIHILRTANTNPLLRLENNGASVFQLHNTSPATDVQWQFQAQDNATFVINDRPGDAGDGVTELILDGAGNLTVAGNLTTQNPAGTFPDYVFAPDYELMPLAELSEFVTTQRHLPNVPTAQEVASKGLNMTQMQIRLVEKVEELTLYTIAQEKTITDLNARLSELEKR